MADGTQHTDETMDISTAFDLSAAIQQWRERLAQSPAIGRANIDELESHLHDSMAALQSKGLSAEEAFLVAVQRIGRADRLEPEFAKVNGRRIWLDRVLWMLLGIQLYGLVLGVARGLTIAVVGVGSMGYGFNADRLVGPVIVSGLVYLALLTACIAGCAWLLVNLVPRLAARLGRSRRPGVALAGTGLVLWPLAVVLSHANAAVSMVLSRFMDRAMFGAATLSYAYSTTVIGIVLSAVLLVVLLVLARRRLSHHVA